VRARDLRRTAALSIRRVALSAVVAGLAACGGGGGARGTAAPNPLSAAAALGESIFHDTALSASGLQSCATCHVESRAFAGDDGLAVPLGGPEMDLPGFRNAPSLMYVSFTPAFHIESDGSPNGGAFRDGRARDLVAQALQPFVTPFEMANADAAEVVARLRTRPYLDDFVALYGADVLDDPDTALQRIASAVAAYEREDVDFRPFSSKFDAFRAGRAELSSKELNGLRLFNDPTRGNCAACHPSASADGKTPALFTDFSYDNLGLPRNAMIPANDDATTLADVRFNSGDGVHTYYDAGLCGPFRTDQQGISRSVCGAFKVPTLRNVALTAPYFHNGVFATLHDALAFYVTRDTRPASWYPVAADDRVVKFDDLEAIYGGAFTVDPTVPGSDVGYVGNVNTTEIPYNRLIGEAPSLTSDEIDDVVAFLCTLTDGYDPAHPESAPVTAECPAASG